MTTYGRIRRNRRLTWAGIALCIALILGFLVLALSTARSAQPGSGLAGTTWLLIAAVPPTLAWFSLDRRPSLLPAASWAAAVIAVVGLFQAFIPPVHLVPAMLWYLAHRRRPRRLTTSSARRIGAVLLGLSIALPMTLQAVHLDPVCVDTTDDGRVLVTRDDTAPAGWGLGGAIIGTSSSGGGADEQQRTCWNDSVLWWEAAAAAASAITIVIVGFRWPIEEERRPAGVDVREDTIAT
jgi:hypothetical protein